MKTPITKLKTAILMIALALGSLCLKSQTNLLTNPGFDSSLGDSYTQPPWYTNPNGEANAKIDGWHYQTPYRSLHMYTGTDPLENHVSVYQDVTIPSYCYMITCSLKVWTPAGFSWIAGSYAQLRVSYYNGNTLLATESSNTFTSGSASYEILSINDSIPMGTTRIRYLIYLEKQGVSGQSIINVDDTYMAFNGAISYQMGVNITAGATEICQGTNITFNTNVVNGFSPTYNWLVNGVSSGNISSFSTSNLNNNDNVQCVVTSNNLCVTNSPVTSNTITISVNQVPALATAIIGLDSVCKGDTVLFTVNPITDADYYTWTLPPNTSILSGDSTNTITVDFSNSSTGNISVHGVNNCGSGSSSVKNIAVKTPPAAPAFVSGPLNVCEGDNGVIYTASPVQNALFYNWQLPTNASGASDSSKIIVDFWGAQSGSLSVQSGNECGLSNMAGLNVSVNPIPTTPTISFIDDTLSSDAPIGNQWYFNGTAITNATSQTYTPTQDGEYYVIVTLLGCESDSSNHIHIIITNNMIISNCSLFRINLFPNPASELLYFENNHTADLNVSIYDIRGLLLQKTNVKAGINVINISSLMKGLYFMKVETENGNIVNIHFIKI